MQGRNKGNVSEEVSFINTQNSGHNPCGESEINGYYKCKDEIKEMFNKRYPL